MDTPTWLERLITILLLLDAFLVLLLIISFSRVTFTTFAPFAILLNVTVVLLLLNTTWLDSNVWWLASEVVFLEILYLSASNVAKEALAISVKSDVLTVSVLLDAVFSTCALMNNFDWESATSEIFFFGNSAYNPASFKNICGLATWIPVAVKLDKTAPATTPETLFTAISDTTLRLSEIALIRLTLGSEFVVY